MSVMGGWGTPAMTPMGMAKLSPVATCSALLLTTCAHHEDARLTMPSTSEICGYVAEHWTADFDIRFGRFAGRPGQSSVLVSVTDARCEPNFEGAIAECSYDVTARRQLSR